MKQFLIQIAVFSVAVLISCYFVFTQADGYTDAFYLKFTTPKQHSLIIGSSRAGQGLQPHIFNEALTHTSIYNYAFSRIHTPYGRPYFESIQGKLDTTRQDGVFIVEVNPWSISRHKIDNMDSRKFWEETTFINKVKNVSSNPNLKYLMNFYTGRNVEILTKKGGNYHNEIVFVDDFGWFKVKLKDNKQRKQKRTDNLIQSYEILLEDYIGLSNVRMTYLKKTILYLKPYGDVYLVRLPIDPRMLAIENSLMSDFDLQLEKAAIDWDVDYINLLFMNEQVEFTDGNHLIIESGERISKLVADSIQQLK